MAEIKIYGTLKNDTGEPIVTTDQVFDTSRGKYLNQLIGDEGGGSSDAPLMTAEEGRLLAEKVFDENNHNEIN